ncbi:MAG: RluA family pseudouridine synthase [Bacteroidota bacterium]|nr:RluA family pseudouridine synthase [Bacteroidota bacterium]MDP4229362.1 RluA family pseudouridine synthase [Bacteroidota bacterium]MDP4236356.1 RluA family pseudouridine synthase [Bacteroidota bacterium]
MIADIIEEIGEELETVEAPASHRIISVAVPKGESPERIDQYLARMIANTSRSKVQEALAAEAVRVNGEVLTRGSYKIKGGDEIELRVPSRGRMKAQAEEIALDIVFEDSEMIVINKPAGMVVHPTLATNTGTLVNALLHHIDNLSEASEDPDRPGIVHRLDKDTSGLIVVAKNEHAHRVLAKQFFNHSAHRVYHAICWGNPKQRFGKIETQIGRHPKDRKKFAVVAEGGKLAITEYFIVEEFRGFSLIELKLKTGRTHQIRVHMQYLGHPVFGDVTYGGRALAVMRHDVPKFKQFVDNMLDEMPRQALHAKTLRLHHPTTGELMEWTTQLPEDMQNLIRKMKKM